MNNLNVTTTTASEAMLGVLEAWGVKNIYGLPGGSFDSTMNAIHAYRERIRYVGVRHEEVGALAAVAEAKLTGEIGVVFGSAGPGAAHLLNGLYDAKTDGVPVLALIGQVPTFRMNTDYFQEMDENPMFQDVSVYDRTVMTAEQLPQVVDSAIRTAYEKRGVAVVILPKDLGWQQIPDTYVPSAGRYVEQSIARPAPADAVERVLDLIAEAKRPALYFGRGATGAGQTLQDLSEQLRLPLVASYLAKGILPDHHRANMLSTGRVAAKPGVDVARAADLVIFAGTNYEFPAFAPDARFVDVNLSTSAIAGRHPVEIGILADAPTFLAQLLDAARARGEDGSAHRGWYEAALEDRDQWDQWIASKSEDDRTPLRFEPIYREINRVAAPDAIFGADVGNINIAIARFLDLHGRTQIVSPLYATMGFGLPASIAAALRYPDREIWSLSGDGGLAMVVPDLITQVEHHLPVINVVFTNKTLGFIEAEQDDTHQPHSGIDLMDVDFATVAQGFGVRGITVRTRAELIAALDEVKGTTEPVLIDVKITDDRMLPVEAFPHDRADRADFDAFVQLYEAEDLEPFAEILARHDAN